MDLNAEVAVLKKSRRTLTRWGIWGTALYLGALLGYGVFAWRDFTALSPNEVGDFLAGAFAPLAFLWLVLGYRMQALELEQNSKALRQQAEEMRNAVEQANLQATALIENKNFVRQDVVNNTKRMFETDLATLSANVCLTFFEADFRRVDSWWERVSGGDCEVFARRFIRKIRESDSIRANIVYAMNEESEEKYIAATASSNSPFWRYAANYTERYREMAKTLSSLGEGELAESYENRDFGLMNKFLLGAEKARN